MADVDDWVTTAMSDDSAVAELLTRFRRRQPPKRSSLSPPPLEWTVRQRRSKPTPRASPTTPLSWSGATSASGGAGDGAEESSRPLPPLKQLAAAGSKVGAVCGINTNKRQRKRKTLAELKEEETLLVKERKDLNKQLSTLLDTLEKQRAVNESLKKYKIDLQSQSTLDRILVGSSMEAFQYQMQENSSFAPPSSSISPEDLRREDHEGLRRPTPTLNDHCSKFVLPDLNLAIEEDSNIAVL